MGRGKLVERVDVSWLVGNIYWYICTVDPGYLKHVGCPKVHR